MAGFLPTGLVELVGTPADLDVLVIQVDGEQTVKKVSYSNILSGALTSADIGVNVASLVGGLVPTNQLPSYVDDVLEFANLGSLPVTGETGKLYITIDTNKTYRWTGTVYTEIGSGLYASDIGVTVQGYDVNTVVDASYVHTDNNYTTVDKTKVDFISVTGAVNLDNMVVNGDIGVTVQGYDVNTVVDASYVHTDNNYTTVDKTKVGKIESVTALTPGVNVAVDMSTASQFSLAPIQNFTLDNPTGLVAGQRGFITITQDVTGGRTITLGSNYKTVGGLGITLTATPSAVDVIRFEVISTSLILVELIADVK